MVEIRLATAHDAMSVAEAHVRAWQVGYRGLISQDHLDALRAEDRARRYGFERMDLAGPFTQVAADGATICGHVTTGLSRDPDLAGAGEIWALYVDPSRWGEGIGRRLLAAGCIQLARQGCEKAGLWVLSGNVRARRFYESAGWRFDGTERNDDIGADLVHEVRYARTLDGSVASER
ncbi:MAG: GNAT family N-acetyltransferase [Mycolicibacterium neoaurum]|uniref:GNAT family N-acetyltransferase n=1 Tax=Mycolicibacterium neoaurum TaxID=1795 RepID=UPI002FF75E3C